MHNAIKRAGVFAALLALCICTLPALAHNDFVKRPGYQVTPTEVAKDTGRLLFLSEGFEGAWPPVDWTIMTSGADYTWDQTNAAANSGAFSAWVQYGAQGNFQDEWLVTPAVDLSGATMPILSFYEDQAYWDGYGLRHQFLVSTTVPNDPGAFTLVEEHTPANHAINGFGGDPYEIDLSAYVGEPVVYVAFRYEGDWADDWFVDDISIYEPSDHDVAAVAALPTGHFDGGDSVLPQAVVGNVGLNTETFDVLYEIYEAGTTLVYSELNTAYDLAPGDVATLDYPFFVVEAGTYYETQVTTLLAGDEEPANDFVTGGFNTYLFGHVPMMFLFTNSGCGPCVQANVAFDDYMPDQGNTVALMRIHAWWPYGGDIMYLANVEQNTAYVDEYGVSGVPHMWMDGTVDLLHDGAAAVAAFDAAKYEASPMTVTPVFWDMANDQLHVTVDIGAPLPASDYRLVSCITEDNIEHNGGNGEPIHHQAFRYAYPSLEGTPIPGDVGIYDLVIDMPLDAWEGGPIDWNQLRATCYVQDRGNHEFRDIVESGTAFLHEITEVTPVVLSSFSAETTPGSVELAWETQIGDLDFRLVRDHAGEQVEIDWSSTQPGMYEALDNAALLRQGGDFTYRLYGRDGGEDWDLLRSEQVEVDAVPLASVLRGSYPNPFNPKTSVSFQLAASGAVRLSVHDIQGRHVATLLDGHMEAGDHTVEWNGMTDAGHSAGSGIYFIHYQAAGVSQSHKVVLAK